MKRQRPGVGGGPPAPWRSLGELAGSPELAAARRREHPPGAAEWDPAFDRRRFLQLSGASAALAGVTACSKQPPEAIVPYVRQPEEVVPGRPLYYATAALLGGYALGILAESHTGRPTKIEGNPDHPASLGGTDLFAQASVLELYDPDRSQAITQFGAIRTWAALVDELSVNLQALEALAGEGLRILSGSITSPTVHALLGELLKKMPRARWHRWEAVARDHERRGSRAAFGEVVDTRYDIARCEAVLAVDADFLTVGPAAVCSARELSRQRRVHDAAGAKRGMTRLYALESTPSSTGSVADHRLAVTPSGVGRAVLGLASRLGVAGVGVSPELPAEQEAWLDAVAADLAAHRGRSAVVPGEWVDAEVHTLVHAINAALGNFGATVLHTPPVEPEPVDHLASLTALTEDMKAGKVDTLIFLGANPVYDAPVDLDFATALDNVRLRVHLGLHADETAAHCQWHVPAAHALESWGDARAFDGAVTVLQPLIEPLYGGKTAAEIVAVLLGRATATARELVREHWQQDGRLGREAELERRWRRALHDGVVPDTALEPRDVTLDAAAVSRAAAILTAPHAPGLELAFRPDPTVYDGRFANNGWLQECPKPLTKLTWDNALLMSPATAREAGLGDLVAGGDQSQEAPLVTLTIGERTLAVPVWVVPGHADGALTLHLGYGRRACGHVGTGAGFDAYALRTSDALWRATGVAIERFPGHYRLASTQDHHAMEGRDLVRSGTLADYRGFLGRGEDGASFPQVEHEGPPSRISLMPAWSYDGYAWGMTVDLGACTGCNACVVACQAENNIPTVGKEQVAKGREMHWIRIDRYYEGDADRVTAVHQQPVLCMQCEQAPCEVVCPVAATVHSDEGLNDMVYNRCVGTRYCSNNCPYKVRRFNFLLYSDWQTPSLKLQRNPDVTVRSRGVMEKCTYCVQRINQARIAAKRERRRIRDGEVTVACQQACPSEALVFGDLNDPASRVARTKASPLDYALLEPLGTRPRTTYLAKVRNPNPALAPATPADVEHGA